MEELVSLILPSGILEHFEVRKVEELQDSKSGNKYYCIHLDEKNVLPSGYSSKDYESKGFYEAKMIQDFPIRGKAVFLSIRKRRWRHKENPSENIKNDYSFLSENSKITKELSDFLKETD